MFIAFEGIDAAGKHTQSERLREHYEGNGKRVTKCEFPMYESITGGMIRDHLTGVWKAQIFKQPEKERVYMVDPSTYLFQCCQLVNRMETLPDGLWNQMFIDQRLGGDVYIADRYNASAYAYGLAFGIDLDWLLHTHKRLPQPDLNIFLDITVEESFKRRPDRRDEYEKNSAMLNKVRGCYLKIFGMLGETYAVIDASGTQEQTFDKILAAIAKRTGAMKAVLPSSVT